MSFREEVGMAVGVGLGVEVTRGRTPSPGPSITARRSSVVAMGHKGFSLASAGCEVPVLSHVGGVSARLRGRPSMCHLHYTFTSTLLLPTLLTLLTWTIACGTTQQPTAPTSDTPIQTTFKAPPFPTRAPRTATPAPPTASPIPPTATPNPTSTRTPRATPSDQPEKGLDQINCGPDCAWDFAPTLTNIKWLKPPTVTATGTLTLTAQIGENDRLTLPGPQGGNSNIALTDGARHVGSRYLQLPK